MSALAGTLEGRLAPGQRLLGAARTALFLVIGVPLGVVYLVAVPIAALAGPEALQRLLEVERVLVNRLLCARIPAPPFTPDVAVDRRQIGFLVAKLPITVGAAVFCAVPAAVLAELVARAVQGLAGGGSYLGPWPLSTVVGLVLVALAVPALVLTVGALCGVASLIARVSRRGLRAPTTASATVREALAERLGDRALAIAYWLPEREEFVDERGDPVTLPGPGSAKAWTAVQHRGSRVAAIIHDAELQARPELVEAAAAGAVLALDNERLKADLHARLQELRASRRRIVEAIAEGRRQLERDLHDGVQQRLVSLSLDLQLLRGRTDDGSSLELLDATIANLGEALDELRDFARGIHPPMLSERGLHPALEALAQRSAVPVELELSVDGRLPREIESAGYFVVAEALTNVAKYARATYARVSASGAGGVLVLEIADDGVGGADPARGSGLRGLSDRVAALDGELTIDSPVGHGTRVRAVIPSTDPRA
jgi:signal transduction histidine kinase